VDRPPVTAIVGTIIAPFKIGIFIEAWRFVDPGWQEFEIEQVLGRCWGRHLFSLTPSEGEGKLRR
jgi:hypothetical protein